MNKEITKELVGNIVYNFLHEVVEGERFAYENAVHSVKKTMELTAEQEAMLRNSIYHLEVLVRNKLNLDQLDFVIQNECNIILWTLAADWHCLNYRTLGDREEYQQQNKPTTKEQ